MSFSRRVLLSALAGSAGVAAAQSFFPGLPNVGFRADNVPERTECGIGALMPWADGLYAITYNSHKKATGTGLGLYRLGDDLKPELIHLHNGTHANRFIHHQSNQCIIGPYIIDSKGKWRFIEAFEDHRLTSTMQHLTDPANRVYFQTMEGLFFEMDISTLRPKLLFDIVKEMKMNQAPHFKGAYTAQNRVVVTNNGFYAYGDVNAGLFEWDGGKTWRRLSNKPHMDVAARQNMGNVMFATGWDESSVLLSALVDGKWQRYRLPKASHAMEQAWQTEWMRIREVETEHFLMDIHGMFYELQPLAFEGRVWGVKPICQHLRIVPDYCAFRGLMALGGNQTSPNNDNNAVVGQPQSGLWFGKTDDLWNWGKPQGWGGPWRNASVEAGVPSDPFLFTGFERKALHVRSAATANVTIEIDFLGNGEWVKYESIRVDGGGYKFFPFPDAFSAHWVRLIPDTATRMTAEFMFT
jgi:hypothetical protein